MQCQPQTLISQLPMQAAARPIALLHSYEEGHNRQLEHSALDSRTSLASKTSQQCWAHAGWPASEALAANQPSTCQTGPPVHRAAATAAPVRTAALTAQLTMGAKSQRSAYGAPRKSAVPCFTLPRRALQSSSARHSARFRKAGLACTCFSGRFRSVLRRGRAAVLIARQHLVSGCANFVKRGSQGEVPLIFLLT